MSTTTISPGAAHVLAAKDDAVWNLPLASLQSQLKVTLDGLTSADAAARLAEYGPNILRPRRRRLLVWESVTVP
jgi:P-type Mg2+ transporter